MTQRIAPIGSVIPARDIRPGYVLDLPNAAATFPVERVDAHPTLIRVSDLPAPYSPHWRELAPEQTVTVRGYFNPEQG